jgi:ribosomal protein S18 acetylase RimI-like enzyme
MNEARGGIIGTAGAADAARLSELVNSAYRGDYSRQGWTTEADLLDGTRTDAAALKEIIARPGTVILKYVENEKILACVELVMENTHLYLGMLTVEPSLQGKGVGKVLVRAAEEYASENHCKKIHMSVITVRKELIDWYKRLGYADTGKRKPFAFSDPRFGQPRQPLEFMVMEKSLR